MSKNKILYGFLGIVFLFGIALLFFYGVYFKAPAAFPVGTVITIEKDKSLKSIADKLEEHNIVRSSVWLTNFVILTGRESNVTSGDYYFPEKQTVLEIAKRITRGDYQLLPTKITIPEGSDTFAAAEIIRSKFKSFSGNAYITIAKDLEGYLFPDTYLFMPSVTPEEVVEIQAENFRKKIASVQEKIDAFDHSLGEVITMASILEGEARQTETRQIVAGILWKRIEMGMPLQVDATFKYINGKTSDELTLKDLQINSPYNTYKYKGLPPSPISNPGLDAITAAVTPIATPYYYFLTDDEGVMHYSKTLEEHRVNQNKYLNAD